MWIAFLEQLTKYIIMMMVVAMMMMKALVYIFLSTHRDKPSSLAAETWLVRLVTLLFRPGDVGKDGVVTFGEHGEHVGDHDGGVDGDDEGDNETWGTIAPFSYNP